MIVDVDEAISTACLGSMSEILSELARAERGEYKELLSYFEEVLGEKSRGVVLIPGITRCSGSKGWRLQFIPQISLRAGTYILVGVEGTAESSPVAIDVAAAVDDPPCRWKCGTGGQLKGGNRRDNLNGMLDCRYFDAPNYSGLFGAPSEMRGTVCSMSDAGAEQMWQSKRRWVGILRVRSRRRSADDTQGNATAAAAIVDTDPAALAPPTRLLQVANVEQMAALEPRREGPAAARIVDAEPAPLMTTEWWMGLTAEDLAELAEFSDGELPAESRGVIRRRDEAEDDLKSVEQSVRRRRSSGEILRGGPSTEAAPAVGAFRTKREWIEAQASLQLRLKTDSLRADDLPLAAKLVAHVPPDISVLLIYSCPANTQPLDVRREIDAIQHAFDDSDDGVDVAVRPRRCVLHPHGGVTLRSLCVLLQRSARDDDLHHYIQFSGHGHRHDSAFLALEPDDLASASVRESGAELVDMRGLADLLALYMKDAGEVLQGVVLNCCHSKEQGRQICAAGVPLVVCAEGPVTDDGAIRFAASYWDGVAKCGSDPRRAFEYARTQLEAAGRTRDGLNIYLLLPDEDERSSPQDRNVSLRCEREIEPSVDESSVVSADDYAPTEARAARAAKSLEPPTEATVKTPDETAFAAALRPPTEAPAAEAPAAHAKTAPKLLTEAVKTPDEKAFAAVPRPPTEVPATRAKIAPEPPTEAAVKTPDETAFAAAPRPPTEAPAARTAKAPEPPTEATVKTPDEMAAPRPPTAAPAARAVTAPEPPTEAVVKTPDESAFAAAPKPPTAAPAARA